MAAFEYRQSLEVRDVFARYAVRYLFIGKSGAILLGYPDTTQDADLFLDKSPENGRAVVAGLRELGFALTESEAADIARGKDVVQLRNGAFDLDLVFAPDGIERFEDAWSRRVDVEGFPVCWRASPACGRFGNTGCRGSRTGGRLTVHSAPGVDLLD
jgi:hypothetical protein